MYVYKFVKFLYCLFYKFGDLVINYRPGMIGDNVKDSIFKSQNGSHKFGKNVRVSSSLSNNYYRLNVFWFYLFHQVVLDLQVLDKNKGSRSKVIVLNCFLVVFFEFSDGFETSIKDLLINFLQVFRMVLESSGTNHKQFRLG